MMQRWIGAVLLVLALLGGAPLAHAQITTPDAETVLQPLPEHEQTRARNLWKQVRCVVCSGQSIAQSNAPLASDLRRIVAEQVAAGASSEAVLHFLAQRYGDGVLMAPPLNRTTGLLWAAPLLLLVLGAVLSFPHLRKRTS